MATSDPSALDEVRELYGDYPFPSRAWHQLQRLSWLPAALRRRLMKTDYQRTLIHGIRRYVPGPRRILDAGCGTGEFSISLARAYPKAELLALDLNPRSLDRAREVAGALGLEQIRFERADLNGLCGLDPEFDLVVCLGVVHHLKDPEHGLRNVARALAPEGRMILWFYGELGRHELQCGIELLKMLVPDGRDVGTKIALSRRLGLIPRPGGNWLHRLGRRLRGLKSQWEEDAFVADAFAHPRVREYDAARLIGLLGSADLELEAFIGSMCNRPEEVWSDPEVLRRVSALPPDQVMRAIELTLRPADYPIVARRRA